MRILKKTVLALFVVCFSIYSYGQTSVRTLKVGDLAPEIKVTWLKGTPVESISKDHIYVVEFWATWCGPCKAAMPHLSQLAKQYEGKVIFIGVNVWEKGFQDKLYESFLPSLREFVESMGDNMAYNVAMDNNDLFMSKNWMSASGQNGIPATFLIKDSKIIWMGHPMKLDKTLEELIAGTYDLESNAKIINQSLEKAQDRLAPLLALNKTVEDAVAAKDYSSALNAIDNAMVTMEPVFKILVNRLKFTTYLEYDIPQALSFAKEWSKENSSIKWTVVADVITKKDGLPKEAYQFAVESYTEAISIPGSLKPLLYHFIAQNCFKMDDFENAVNYEEKAIQTGNEAIAKGEFQGTINNNSIKEFQDALAMYKESLK